MAYTNLENLINIIPKQELINLTNDTVPASEVNEKKVESAIDYAEEFINSYLRNKYRLPLKYTPEIIVNIATDIAAYRLYSRRPRKLPDHIKEGYEEAKSILKKLQKEEQILDLPAEHPDKNVTMPAKMVLTNMSNSSTIFNDSIWEMYR